MLDGLTKDEWTHGKWWIQHKKIDRNKLLDNTASELGNGYTYLHAPPGYFYADPICINHEEIYYVFFELFDYIKGKLAYYKLDKDLNPSEPVLLDIDHQVHISYPHIFKENGKYYIIPETCHLNKINLYECVEFPGKWRLKKTLIDNVHTGDNTLLKKDGLYWIFTTVYHNQMNHFAIYLSESLFGPWTRHKQANMDDSGRSGQITRGAGKIFQIGDKLIRPAQYSDRQVNGEAVILYQINKLTPEEYEETPLTIVSKSMVDEARAIHTFSLCDDILCLDGRLKRELDPEWIDLDLPYTLLKLKESNSYVC